MPVNPVYLEELFDKYVRGNITPEEFAEFWQMVKDMQDSDTLSSKLTSLWREWEGMAQPGAGPDKSKVFTRIMEKGREREIDFEKLQAYPMTRRWRTAAVAAVLLAAFAGVYLLYTNQTKPKPQLATTITPPDYTRHITLPDGSTVVLHAGSTLIFSPAFPSDGREVTLKGQAYFDVVHNDKKPFIIHTGKVRTTVLGTAFNISSDSSKVTVSVTGGKVRVEDDKKILGELSPNQQIVYKVPESATEKQTVNAEQLVTNWTKQDMIFDGDSFGDIVDILTRRYGVTIRFKNPELAKCLIVASFSGTETLENVLQTLCTIRSASYAVNPDSKDIWVDGKGCE